ncbi:lipopolysaccharide biosynthesis protein, partial [Priestia megaterium]
MSKIKSSNNIFSASKWSFITEIFSKLITPIVNVVLARILDPEAFGIIATITIVISFVDIFTDAGFQKYIVQKEFKNNEEKYTYANVAFWTNLILSILLWSIITIGRDEVAELVGNKELSYVLPVACLQIIFTAFISIQMALYRRDFNFKTLFVIRMATVSIPVIVTIPLAIIGWGFWSIIIGNLASHFFNAILLTYKSEWKPSLKYSFSILKNMLSFSIWSLIEAISIWLTVWVDAFIISKFLDKYYLGLYTTSTSLVNVLMSTITASTVPVLFAALSRLQDDEFNFQKVFLKTQRIVSIVVFPMGVGLFLYSDLATTILLGEKWAMTSNIIGMWALTSSLVIVMGFYASEVYRAKGRPKLSFLAQILHLLVLIPTIVVSVQFGFLYLIYARSLIRLQSILVHLVLLRYFMNIKIGKTLKNLFPTMVSVIAMGILSLFLKTLSNKMWWDILSIIICAIVYF